MEPLSSSTFASSSVSSTISEISNWFQDTFGLDFFEVLGKIIDFMILLIKLSINVLLDILPRILEWIAGYGG